MKWVIEIQSDKGEINSFISDQIQSSISAETVNMSTSECGIIAKPVGALSLI